MITWFQITSAYPQGYRVHGQSIHPKMRLFSTTHNTPQNHLTTELWGRQLPGGHHPETRNRAGPTLKGLQQRNQVHSLGNVHLTENKNEPETF